MSSDKLDPELTNAKLPQPQFVDSPTFAAIAQKLDISTEEAVRFVQAVHKIARRGKLKQILHAIRDKDARTPQEVADFITSLGKKSNASVNTWIPTFKPHESSSRLNEIAQALQCTFSEAARLVASVQLDYRYMTQDNILNHIKHFALQTPEQALESIRETRRARLRRKSLNSNSSPCQQVHYELPEIDRGPRKSVWMWNPDTGSIEPSSDE